MKNKHLIYIVILVFVSLIGMWGVPSLVKKATYTPEKYPFIHYSSMLEKLCIIEYKDKKTPLKDLDGHSYKDNQIDSLLPLLNYRQLVMNGKMPDSIHGKAVDVKQIRAKSVVFRFNPDEMQQPDLGLYILFESMPKRGKLEIPDDIFRLKNNIEFIDVQTNTVNPEKSELFQSALEKEGFKFPSQWNSGNMNPRKPYDEGYFSLDSQGQLFHTKMVNGRPYVKDTKVGQSIDIAHFSMLEVADKRFYGFLFSKKGEVYILEGDAGKYQPVQLDINPLDLKSDEFAILGNMLYWTITIKNQSGAHYYALDANTLQRVAEHRIERTEGRWDQVSAWLFPVYLTFQKKESAYIAPEFHFTGFKALGINLLLVIIFCIFARKQNLKQKITGSLLILVTGIAGGIALLVVPRN